MLWALAWQACGFTITRRSTSILFTDAKEVQCSYAAYAISNDTTTVTYSNVWVKVDSFTGTVVRLGGGDPGVYALDDLAPGQTKMVYVYLYATNITATLQTHTVRVYDGYPGVGTQLASTVFTLTAKAPGANNSSKVNSVTYSPAVPTVGGYVMITVNGDCGQVGNNDINDFTPAAFTNWNAGAFELVNVNLWLTNKSLAVTNVVNYLQLPAGIANWSGGQLKYNAYYLFHCIAVTSGNTPVSPITLNSQGQTQTHTDTSGYGAFAPIQTPTNTTVLSKLANLSQLYTNEIAVYTIRITNSGPNAVTLDRIVDTLPAGISYVAGSSKFNGVTVLNPAIAGSVLTWSESYTNPAYGACDLTFQATPATSGYATNSVIAYAGSSLVDATYPTTDNVPATNTVRVLLVPTAVADTGATLEDTLLTVAAPGVLGNDSEPNGFPVTVASYTQPANGSVVMNANGSYTYTPAANYFGTDSFTYTLTNGNARSSTATVTIAVTAVNDAPSFTAGPSVTNVMNSGAITVANWATSISAGPANESSQTLTFQVSNNNNSLFSVQPAISSTGTLTYSSAANASGTAIVTVYLQDNGGTANGGIDSSSTITFTIQVTAYSIGNYVFADWNNNGNRDVGDEGIGGVRMLLFASSAGSPSGSVLQSAVTTTNGTYRFDDVPAGTYIVVVDQVNSLNLTGYVSSTGYNTNAAGDQFKDHGQDTLVMVTGGVTNGIAGIPVTVGPGLQPLEEITGNAPGPGQHGPCGDAFDSLMMTFSFTPATYSIGNRVFLDNGTGSGGVENDGNRNGTEAGIASVAMKLFAADDSGSPTGSSLASTNTDSSGYYRFDGLITGTYVVVVDVGGSGGALSGLVSSAGASTDLTAAGDLKDHGKDTAVSVGGVVGGIASTPITVGVGLQPTSEATGSGAGAYGPYGDTNDNLVVDFGFAPAYSAGNLVFLDNGAGGGTANNGILDGAEAGIASVSLNLYVADGSGNPTGGVVGTTSTDSSGYYRFDNLPAGSYVVVVNVLGSGSALNGLWSSGVVSSDNSITGDNKNHGKNTPLGSSSVLPGGIASGKFTLGAGLQPSGEATGAGAGAHGPTGDAGDNLVIDFGFAPSSAFYSVGNRVFLDDGSGGGAANNGIRDGSEPGIANVGVKLYAADASGSPTGSALASTTTDSSGYYRFDNLGPGAYVVVVDAAGSSTALSGLQSSHGSSADFALAGDLKDHGQDTPLGSGSVLLGGIASAAFTLGSGMQPTGEALGSSGAGTNGPGGDASDNLVVDFGFAPTTSFFSIGHRVFNDNGVGGGNENNGLQDGSELGISNVVVKLFAADGSGNPIGSARDTQTTDVGGYYRFDGAGPGTYVVVVDEANSPILAGYVSSKGYSTATDTASQYYDHGQDTPVTVTGAVTNGIASVPVKVGVGLQPTGEATGSGAGANGPSGDASDNLAINFGFTPTYSLGNKIYKDPDDDGTPDEDSPDEPGWPNVVLYVFAADSSGNITNTTPVATATTDPDGYYRFDGLVAGTYVVVVDQANSASLSQAHLVNPHYPGSGDYYNKGIGYVTVGRVVNGVASAPVAVGWGLQPLAEAIGSGQGDNGPLGDAFDNLTVDIGFYPLFSIGNRVFRDDGAGGAANNGIQDGGEPGIANVVVKLFLADNSGTPIGFVLATTNTDAGGYYRFDGLLAGDYVVVVDKANSSSLAGYVSSAGASTDTTISGDLYDHGMDTPLGSGSVVPGGIVSTPLILGDGLMWPLGEATEGTGAGAHGPTGDLADYLTLDFGFAPAATVSGTVFVDSNGNGVLDAGEAAGISGVTISLETTGGALVATTTTGVGGTYQFTEVPAGNYLLVETDLPGWVSTADTTSPNDNLIPLTLASGQTSTGNNFLDTQLGSLAGSVLEDANRNGVFDSNDTPIGGVTLALKTNGVTVATTTTGVGGTYLFANVIPGNYVVVQTDLAGWTSTADTDGPNDNQIAVTLASGQAITGNNFLDVPPVTVWAAAGSLSVGVTNATGAPGAGYSLQSYSGYLDVQATSGSPFVIQLVSYNGTVPGLAANWSYSASYVWTVATTTDGVLNFDPSKFTVNTDQFVNDLAGGSFSVTSDGQSVYVVFMPHTAPAANWATFGRAWGTFLRIPVPMLLTNYTAAAGGEATLLTQVGASTNGSYVAISSDSTQILYAPINNFSETFSYVIRDNHTYRPGDTIQTATSWITIVVTNAVSSVNAITSSGNDVTITFAGIPGYRYAVERSSFASDWTSATTVQAITAPAGGVWTFTDWSPPNPAFYRLRQNN